MSAPVIKAVMNSRDDAQLYQLCRNNPDLKLERDRHVRFIVMAPVGRDRGQRAAGYITN
jgi:hypothetical protein